MKLSGMMATMLVLALVMTFAGPAAAAGPGVPDPGTIVCTSGLLTVDEEADILYMREEEKVARDVYLAMYDLWQIDVFATIAESEQRHMDSVLGLIECFELIDPVVDDTPGAFTNPDLAAMYTALIDAGTVSGPEALRVGLLIEETDIADLRAALAATDKVNIIQVYTNLEAGSCNHLRAFYRNLLAAGETYTPQILTQEEFDEIIDAGLIPSQNRNRHKEPFKFKKQLGLVDDE